MTAHDASEQTDFTVDVLADDMSGQSVDPSEQEVTGATENDESKDWRKSQKTWQEMTEKAKKGEKALEELQKLKDALGVSPEKKEDVDPVQVLQQKLADLEMKAELASWEKAHPAVDTEANRDAWQDMIAKKGHLVKSGELTWDDLWAIVRKGAPKSSTAEKYESQSQNIGSVPPINSSARTNTHGIDPDVYSAMKKAGWTDKQIQNSAL